MSTVPALPIFDPFFLMALHKPVEAPKPKPKPNLEADLKAMFPDLLVHGTRGFLLNATTSLNKTASKAHTYFSRLSQALAFERMMREFQQLTAPMAQFFAPFAGPSIWSAMFPAHQQQPALPWSVPKPQQQKTAGWPVLPAIFAPQPTPHTNNPPWMDYGAFLMPVAVLASAPLLDTLWGFGA